MTARACGVIAPGGVLSRDTRHNKQKRYDLSHYFS